MLEALLIHAVQVQVCVLVEHQRLVTVFLDGKVLELDQPLGNLVLADEKARKQHERQEQHGRQSHCQLLVAEQSADDQSVTTSCVVAQNQNDD